MGELLLCNRPIAAMPYYIESLSLNIYSLEELCYLIGHQMLIPEESFFNEELFSWIERETGAAELAEELRSARLEEESIVRQVERILRATSYFSRQEVTEMVALLENMQMMSVFERRKMRADHYADHKKYVNALLEYRRILLMENECREQPVVCGNIWHNQGMVLARLFLFAEAKECFETAYRYHMNIESIYQAMACCFYMDDMDAIKALAKKYGVEEAEVLRLISVWQECRAGEEVVASNKQLEAIFAEEYDSIEENGALRQLLEAWKQEYRKNCG